MRISGDLKKEKFLDAPPIRLYNAIPQTYRRRLDYWSLYGMVEKGGRNTEHDNIL